MAKKKTIRRQKHKPTNLVFPLLGFSLLSLMGVTVFLNRPHPTPLTIAELSQPASNCTSVSFTDSFSGTTLNEGRWSAYNLSSSGIATVTNESLDLSIPPGSTGYGKMFVSSENKTTLEGDFVQEIVVKSLSSLPADQLSSFVLGVAATDTNGQNNWYRLEVYSNGDIQTYSTTGGTTTPGATINAFKNTPTKLKMVRQGSTLSTYYDAGDGYKNHNTVEDIYTGKMFIQLILLSHPTTNPTTTAIIDDYKLGCLPPIPTNQTYSCSSDGTKVTLKWDDVSPSHKYHFALNDTSNDTPSEWLIANSTDVWRGGDYNSSTYELPIIPNHKYHWWVQSNANGPFSEKSNYIKNSFICENKPDTPRNLRANCNPDGKSVRLMWDGVVDADSYKVRLDDKSGHVTNFDNLKDLQYITNITPDKTYSFWVHSHKGDFDSYQSTQVEFACKATTAMATSTPKATVKPTIKPTSTPTPSPKVTPTSAKVLFDNTPTPTPYAYDIAPSPIPTVSEPETKSNFLSRFFTWLASLFE